MEILHGFILFLAVKFSSSAQGVVGSSATLNCPFTSTSSYMWQMFVNGVWSNTITNVANKYDGADTKSIIIKLLGLADGGHYRCTSGGIQGQVTLTVTDCSTNGNCSQWSSWTVCSKCGGGYQVRSRQCSGICSGNNYESRYCYFLCQVDGNWGQWGSWSHCSVTCGEGTRSTSRDCNNPSPSNGGADCQGSSKQTEDCSSGLCAVDGNWGHWGIWSFCSLTCGGGTRSRYRDCNNPSPSNGGAECQGNRALSEGCASELCPVNGHLGTWGSWLCSVTCGQGTKARYRSCNNPAPAYGGDDCTGDSNENASCSRKPCSINGEWGMWGYWSSCSVTCDGGTTTRQRSCDNPVQAYNGSDCDGNSTETNSCSVIKCPDFANSSMSVGAVIAGIVSACVVLLTVVVAVFFIVHRRRQKNTEKHNDYEVSEMKQGEDHVYIQTSTRHDYCNTDLRSSVQIKIKEDILIEYNSSEMSKFFLDEKLCAKKVKEEFQWLTKSKPRENVTDYENVAVPSENEMDTSYDTYVKTAILKKHDTDHVAVVTETPNKNDIEMFWTLVNNFKIQDIILLVQKKEKITHFFPVTDEPIEMQSMEVKMISSGRQENDIFLYSLELTDQEGKSVSEIRLYKTTNWKIGDTFPDISTLCKLIINENSTGVIMMGSKGNGYRICGVLGVCLEIVNTIKDDKKFSILQIAQDMVKTRPDLFQTCEEYALCYNILKQYLENEHCYAIVD